MSVWSRLCAYAALVLSASLGAVEMDIRPSTAGMSGNSITNGTFIQFGPLLPGGGHPDVGYTFQNYQQYAGRAIADGSGNTVIGFTLRHPGIASDPVGTVNFCWVAGAIPGAGSTVRPVPNLVQGVPIVGLPQPVGYNYPRHPFPNANGNIFGLYSFTAAGGIPNNGLRICPLTTATRSLIPGGGSTATIVVAIEPPFPGAWALTFVANTTYFTPHSWTIGGIAQPSPTPEPKLRSLNNGTPLLANSNRTPILGGTADVLVPPRWPIFPTAPSETELVYRLYNVGVPAMLWSGISFRAVQGTVTARIKRILAQDGTPMMDVDSIVYPKVPAYPYTVIGYDGTYTPNGPRAYDLGSTPVAPWIDIVLGVTISSVGNWELETSYFTNGTPVTYTSSIVGISDNAPEIEVWNGAQNLIDAVTSIDVGSRVNQVPAKGSVHMLSIRNMGTLNLNLPALPATFGTPGNGLGEILGGGDWDGSGAIVIAPGAQRTLQVRISPDLADPPDAGPFSVTLNIPNNDADESPFSVVFNGTATKRVPILQVSRTRVIPDDGLDIAIGVTDTALTPFTYTVTNAGDRTMTLQNIAVSSSTALHGSTNLSGLPAFPLVLGIGATTTFTANIRAANMTEVWYLGLALTSDSGTYLPSGTSVHNMQITSYSTGVVEEEKECGFGTPFGLILMLVGAMLFRRRRSA